jgi:hypothetical protein
MDIVLSNLFKFLIISCMCIYWGSRQAQAQSAQGAVETDCTDTNVDYSSTGTMTQAERIAAMDRALNQSLNKYDACVSESTNQSGANGGNSGGGSADGSGEGESTEAQGQSTEAAGISGTNTPTAPQAAVPHANEEEKNTENPTVQQQSLANGKIPEDIPPENNDDILAQRIRSAAENEPDPDKQARLWNEYRKYKGLPQK